MLRPVLFALQPEAARRFTCGVLGLLARTRAGAGFSDVLGHMRADTRLARSLGGHAFASPVGMSALLDPAGRAARAFARFGVGFLEVGPTARASEGC